jgi:FkbM family methyltransferase
VPVKKLLRTLQSEFSFLKEAKESFYYVSRKALSLPHERDFKALRFIPEDLPGCYIDVGANRGQSIESIKAIKPRARVFAFEPGRLLADRLQARYQSRPDVTILPFGLAEEKEKERTLFVPVYKRWIYDAMASFDRDSAASWLSPTTLYWFSPDKLKLDESICVTRRLDDQELQPIFIKIDVQGYEYQVVKGGLSTILQYEPILLIEDFHWDDKLGQLLREAGFEQYLFDDNGFYRANPEWVLNAYLMTRRRAGTVRQSTRHNGAAPGRSSPHDDASRALQEPHVRDSGSKANADHRQN